MEPKQIPEGVMSKPNFAVAAGLFLAGGRSSPVLAMD